MHSNNEHFRFSVCIPTFNGAFFIKEQLQSIIPLLNDQDEIIVLDDCSSDETLAILKTIDFPRLRLSKNKFNIGLLGSVERLLELSKGSYIILADQDDVWLPNRILEVIDLLKSGEDFVVTDAVVVDSNRKIIAKSYFDQVKICDSFFKNFYKCKILGCCIAFNRKLLASALPFPKNQLVPHDLWLYLIAKLTRAQITIHPQKCILYRRHANTTSSASFKSKRGFLQIIWARMILAGHLIQRATRLRLPH